MDMVTTHSVSKVNKIDRSAPMEIGMAAGTDGEEAFDRRSTGNKSELAVQAVYKGKGAEGGWNDGMGSNWSVQKYVNSAKA